MKVFFHKDNLKSWIVVAVGMVIGLAVYRSLPEQIPVHWGISGEVDNWGPKAFIFMGPVMSLFCILLAEIRRIDPKKENYEKFQKHYYTIFFLVSLIGLGIELMTIAAVKGIEVKVNLIVSLLVGIVFIIMGNLMPKFKHNYYAGIRTSWTLANEDVWYATHRFAGKIWFAAGFIILVSAFLPPVWNFVIMMAALLVCVLTTAVYSYLKFREITGKTKPEE